MMDLWAIVPYYTAYLSKSLLRRHVNLTIGSITYYLDRDCFRARGLSLHPGLLNIVGRFQLPKIPRRVLKLIESTLNLCALSVRFFFWPPDILHVQFLPMVTSRVPMDLWFVQFFRRRGVKTVLTVHDLLPHDTGQRHQKVFAKLYRGVDMLICHSDHVAERLKEEFSISTDRISVIPHGPFFYDLPAPNSEEVLHSLRLDQEKLIFLFQGIILPYKGVDLLLDAWQRVERDNTEACLVIAGTGAPELLERLRVQIARLQLQRVHLHLRFITTEELIALYRAASVIVYPYRAVTTSGALATGLALGKTLIAADLKVFREILIHGVSALLVDPTDQAQFATSLLRLAADDQLRDSLSSQVKQMNFGDEAWETIALRTTETYIRALSNGNDSGCLRTENSRSTRS